MLNIESGYRIPIDCLSSTVEKQKLLGIELETVFQATFSEMRKLITQLKEEKFKNPAMVEYVNKLTNLTSHSAEDIPLLIKRALVEGLSYNNSLVTKIAPDKQVGEFSAELNFIPLSLEDYNTLYTDVAILLNKLENFRFLAGDNCGIHIWADYTLFGNDHETQLNNIEKMFIFLFKEPEFLIELADRKAIMSSYNDILYMLGDPFKFLDEASLLKSFKASKIDLISRLKKDRVLVTKFGTTFNKLPNNVMETRWFPSTTDANKLYAYLEFVSAMGDFTQKVENIEDITLGNFLENSKKYRRFLNFVRKFKTTQQYKIKNEDITREEDW